MAKVIKSGYLKMLEAAAKKVDARQTLTVLVHWADKMYQEKRMSHEEWSYFMENHINPLICKYPKFSSD